MVLGPGHLGQFNEIHFVYKTLKVLYTYTLQNAARRPCGHRCCQGGSANRKREPRIQGRRHHLSAGAQGGGQGRKDGMAGDCGWYSRVEQVWWHTGPEECGHQGCQGRSAHRE